MAHIYFAGKQTLRLHDVCPYAITRHGNGASHKGVNEMPQDGIFNAIIQSAPLTIERGFILSSYINLDFGGTGQGFGGYSLGGTSGKVSEPSGLNYAGMWLCGVMSAAGVEIWDNLPGKAVRVERANGLLVRIGHIIRDDKWFDPKAAFSPEVQS